MMNTRRLAASSLTASRLLLLAAVVVCAGAAAYRTTYAQVAEQQLDKVRKSINEAQEAEADSGQPTTKMKKLEDDFKKLEGRVERDGDKNIESLKVEANALIKRADALKAQASGNAPNATPTPAPTSAGQGTVRQVEERGTEKTNGKDNGSKSGEGFLDYLPSLSTILLVASSLAAVAALALAGWFVFNLYQRVGHLDRAHRKLAQRFVVFEKTLGEQDVYAQSINSGVVRMGEEMRREMEELRRSYRDMRGGQRAPVAAVAAVADDPFARLERMPVADPVPTFPSLVSDYLSKVSDSKKLEVENDFRTNLFVPAPGGPFVLVQDDDGTGSGIVLPKSRLQKSQEYVSYYKGTYYCDSPSAGEVFVVEPAIVDQAGGGWRLRSPGRLELK